MDPTFNFCMVEVGVLSLQFGEFTAGFGTGVLLTSSVLLSSELADNEWPESESDE